MTTEATESAITVGMQIRSRDDLSRLPVGTQISHARLTNEVYTKIEGDQWRRSSDNAVRSSRDPVHWSLDGSNTVTFLPEPEFVVGQPVGSRDRLTRLPIGTTIRRNRSAGVRPWRKEAENLWRVVREEGGLGATRTDADGRWGFDFMLIESLPDSEPEPSGPQPGDWFTWGARVCWYRITSITDERLTADGHWYTGSGSFTEQSEEYDRDTYDYAFFSPGDEGLPDGLREWLDEQAHRSQAVNGGGVVPESIPDDVSVPFAPTIHDRDTLERFKRRVAAVTLGAGRMHSVQRSPVEEGLRRAGVDPTQHNVAEPGNFYEYTNLSGLPNDTTLVGIWDAPSGGQHAGVTLWRDGGGTTVLRARHAFGNVVAFEVVAVGEETLSLDDVTYADLIEIDEFRSTLRAVGDDAQGPAGWCDVYRSVIRSLGCEDRSVRVARLNPQQVAEEPEGRLLLTLGEEPILVIRDDRSDNPARTQRVGPGEGHWAAIMLPVGFHTGDLLRVHWTYAQRFPVGTHIRYSGGSYEKRSDGWHSTEGYNTWVGCGHNDLVTVTRIGGLS